MVWFQNARIPISKGISFKNFTGEEVPTRDYKTVFKVYGTVTHFMWHKTINTYNKR